MLQVKEGVELIINDGLNFEDFSNDSEGIAQYAYKISEKAGFISAFKLDFEHPIESKKLKTHKENFAALKGEFSDMYITLSAQLFGSFEKEYLEDIGTELIRLHIQKNEEGIQEVRSWLEGTAFLEGYDEICDNPDPAECFKKYEGFHIALGEKNIKRTPMAKCAADIAQEFYLKDQVKKGEAAWNIANKDALILSRYIKQLIAIYEKEIAES